MELKRFGFIAAIIVVLFSVVVLIGSSQSSPLVIIGSMIATTIAEIGRAHV